MRYMILFLNSVFSFSLATSSTLASTSTPIKVRAASMNLCEEGPERGAEGAKRWAKLLRESKADIIALQEVYDFKKDKFGNLSPDRSLLDALVKELGWKKVNEDQASATAILTRLKNDGENILLPNGERLKALSVHLTDTPYQICQIYPCDYFDSPKLSSLEEVFKSAKNTRTKDLQVWLEKHHVQTSPRVLIMGDLNEPSHLDWTTRAFKKGLYKFAMSWPTSHLLTLVGFDDAYRKINTDEISKPGHTYPAPKWPEKFGISTRIDYIFSKGLKTIASGTFDTLDDWPSDHLGVWADFQI